jgi:hypothetical protein
VQQIFIAKSQVLDKAIALCTITLIAIAWGGAQLFDLLCALAAHGFFGTKTRIQAGAHFIFSCIPFQSL